MPKEVYYFLNILHTFPFICTIYLFKASGVRFKPEDAKVLVLMSVIYLPVCYLGGVMRNKPLYIFLTFEDWKSAVICFVFVALSYPIGKSILKVWNWFAKK